MSKELNTVKYRELHSTKPFLLPLRQAAQTVLYSPERKKPTRKKKKKTEQGARLAEALKKSNNINTKFHCKEVTITSKDYKIFLCISKITISKTKISHRPTTSQGQNHKKWRDKEKEREKEKERGKEKEKEKYKKKSKEKRTKKAGLESFPFEAHRPLRIRSLSQFHQWA